MAAANHQCTYAFSQLASRDEVVFKSIVGLLNGRTRVHWEQIHEGSPDLLVLGFSAPEGACAVTSPKVTLRISPKAQEAMSAHWPLRATEVFERLEQAAQMLEAAENGSSQLGPESRFKLLGWPSHSLLASDAGYLRMTTLLGARAMTVAELSERTLVDRAQCERFIELLQAQGLLQEEADLEQVASVEVAPVTTGFFARLRAHLGLATAKAE